MLTLQPDPIAAAAAPSHRPPTPTPADPPLQFPQQAPHHPPPPPPARHPPPPVPCGAAHCCSCALSSAPSPRGPSSIPLHTLVRHPQSPGPSHVTSLAPQTHVLSASDVLGPPRGPRFALLVGAHTFPAPPITER